MKLVAAFLVCLTCASTAAAQSTDLTARISRLNTKDNWILPAATRNRPHSYQLTALSLERRLLEF